MENLFEVKVEGEYACFTRPEFKVERVSYPVMTPSAARGLLEAIFWKPEFRWEIQEVWVLKPIRQMSILRNEISNRQGDVPIFVEEKRQQRASLILKDVAYLIRATMRLKPHATDPLAKYADQFRRRIARGQYHHTPYLGVREFPAYFEAAAGNEVPQELDLDLGQMLFDIAYCQGEAREELTFLRHGSARRTVSGYAQALFFPARLERGILRVPTERYRELYALEGEYAQRTCSSGGALPTGR